MTLAGIRGTHTCSASVRDVRVLVVEDEVQLADAVARGLRREGWAVDVAYDGDLGLEKAMITRYDVVVLDRDLPGRSGDDVCQRLAREQSLTRVLMLTAAGGLADRIAGLDLGADDYLIKPFHLSELNARLRAIIRRRQFRGQQQIVFRDLLVRPELAEVSVHGEPLTLTRKEYDLLLYLLANPGRVLTKEAIAEHLCGDAVDSADSFDFIYTHLKNLRKKMQEKGADNYIRTMYGVGYKLSME